MVKFEKKVIVFMILLHPHTHKYTIVIGHFGKARTGKQGLIIVDCNHDTILNLFICDWNSSIFSKGIPTKGYNYVQRGTLT